MKTIEPKYPNQSFIDQAVEKLSPQDQALYHDLQHQYIIETQKPQPNHELIANLMKKTSELLESLL